MCLNVYLDESFANLKLKCLNRPLVVSLSNGHDLPDELFWHLFDTVGGTYYYMCCVGLKMYIY